MDARWTFGCTKQSSALGICRCKMDYRLYRMYSMYSIHRSILPWRKKTIWENMCEKQL